ncbi:MAG: replicative DNA helicase [Candidatus Margulisbacteria bacterium]|jgi:replicative DNA helicase|nr:replicative DNA helicase [Candidatus Margulisiibacteriota bacterium]
MSEERLPPQNLEAEQSLLGALLLNRDAVMRVMEKNLAPEAFYREAHKHIYQTVLDLFGRNDPIDVVTVAESLKQKDLLEPAGGRVYLADLVNAVTSPGHAEYYAEIVEKNYILRAVIAAAAELTARAFEHDGEPDEILDAAQKTVFELAQRNMRQGFQPIEQILDALMDDIDKNYDNKESPGLQSHFLDLDAITCGFQRSDLIIVAARPSMGKTAFALNVAANMAIKDKATVAIFSLEMSKKSLVERLLCAEAEIDAQNLKSKNLQDFEWKKVARAVSRLSEAPIFIDDSSEMTMVELQAKARRLKIEHDVKLIIVDYLTLIKGSQRRAESRYLEISEIARALKALSKELEIPIIVISQLNRGIEQRSEQTPKMSDLRESGEVEQVADLILFVHRQSYYAPGADAQDNSAQIIVAKHRNGRTGVVDLTFRKELTKFVNRAREEVPVDALG